MDLERLKDTMPYKWRVQSYSKNKPLAICVAYIDSRNVAKHLDDCLGPLNWQDDYKIIGDRTMCGIGVRSEEGWVWKWDTGAETDIEKEKGIISDSFKRAAVKWGVGRFLYDMDVQYIPANEKKTKSNYPYVVDGKGKRVYDLTKHINATAKPSDTSQISIFDKIKDLKTPAQFHAAMEKISQIAGESERKSAGNAFNAKLRSEGVAFNGADKTFSYKDLVWYQAEAGKQKAVMTWWKAEYDTASSFLSFDDMVKMEQYVSQLFDIENEEIK